MKKFCMIILLLLFVVLNNMADEYVIYDGKAYFIAGSMFFDTTFKIKYDDTVDTYYLYNLDMWIYLNDDNLQTIRNTIIKYKEWVKLANENQVKIDKEIPDSRITTDVLWKQYGDWWKSSEFKLQFIAFSQSLERHQFVIQSNKVRVVRGFYDCSASLSLYLDEKQADDFLAGINTNVILDKKAEHNKIREQKMKQQDLFQ